MDERVMAIGMVHAPLTVLSALSTVKRKHLPQASYNLGRRHKEVNGERERKWRQYKLGERYDAGTQGWCQRIN